MDEYYAADGGEDIRRAVAAGGEPFVPQIQAFVDRGQPISVYQYWQLNKRKVASQQAYHDMWDSIGSPSGRPVDILLVPTMPHTAVPHGSCRWTGYTKLFNFLDYTALTFPAGKACKDLMNGAPKIILYATLTTLGTGASTTLQRWTATLSGCKLSGVDLRRKRCWEPPDE